LHVDRALHCMVVLRHVHGYTLAPSYNYIGYNAHINGLPGGYTPGTTGGGNEGEFGILFAREPRGNYKLRNNRTTGGGEVGDFDVTI
jgi:hypothetical protein